jgi:hypothetical protein
MAEKLGVMLCGHGSRDKDAVREFAVLSEHLKSACRNIRSNTAISNSPPPSSAPASTS